MPISYQMPHIILQVKK